MAEQIQGDGNLILSRRRRGAPGGGVSTELPGFRGLMMSGAGGGGGCGWDGGTFDCSAPAKAKKKFILWKSLQIIQM